MFDTMTMTKTVGAVCGSLLVFLLGGWAAEKMGLSAVEAEAYSKAVVQADFEEAGDEDVIRKLLGDLVSAGVDVSEADIRAAMEAKSVEARRALMGEA